MFIKTYKQLSDIKGTSYKQLLRGVAIDALYAKTILFDGGKKLFKQNRVHFLYIHHVFQDEEMQFRQLLELLKKDHVFISYSEAVERILTGNIDAPYICFSSDDGVKNNLRAAEIMQEYGAKACFFINPGIIGETDYTHIAQFCKDALRMPAVEFLNWDEVRKIEALGHEIGAHTMLHTNIAEMSAEAVKADALECMRIMKNEGIEAKHYAFPYGRFFHFTNSAKDAVFAAGYRSFATAERGCHIKPDTVLQPSQLCIRREHIKLFWPLRRIVYFLLAGVQKQHPANNLYPAEV